MHLAETVVVNETQSRTNVKGVLIVMSSQTAGIEPPVIKMFLFSIQ